MKNHRLLSAKWWILGPIAALLVVAIACGEDATPAPAPQIDVGAISSAVEAAVEAAVADLPAAEAPQLDTAAIQSAAKAAVAAAVPQGTSAAEIQALVEKAVAAGAQPGVSSEEVAALVSNAIADAAAAAPEALSAAQIADIVEGALAAQPGPAMEEKVTRSAGEADVPKKGKHVDAIRLSAKYGQSPRYGGTFLNAIFENFPHYDFQQGLGANYMAQAQIYNSLVMNNPFVNGEVIPDLAYAWEISPDGKTYTFHLHEGVKWHDGKPFSSEDVRYAYNRIMTKGVLDGFDEPTCPACRETVWVSLFEGIEAPDPNTVVVKTKGASGSVLKVLMSSYASVLPKHVIVADPVDGLKTEPIPTGTGPFKVTQEPTTVLWKYSRNTDYFKPDLPYMDAMESHLILDQQTRATAVLTERVHWDSGFPAPFLPYELAVAIAEKDPKIIHLTSPTLLYTFLVLNTENPPLDDNRVRQAINEALDRFQFTVDGLGEQNGFIGSGIFPEGQWAWPPGELEKLIGFGSDMEVRRQHARDLLADYEAENGKIDWKNTIRWQCGAEHPSCPVAVIGQQMLKEVGIDIDLKVGEIITTWTNQISGDYDISGFLSGIDFDDPIEHFGKMWITGGAYAFHRNFSTDIDALYQKQIFLTDRDERQKIAWEIDKWAMNESGRSVLLWSAFEHIQRDYVKGWTPHPDARNTNGRLEYVWLDLPEVRRTTR